jgi:hypothetical protein
MKVGLLTILILFLLTLSTRNTFAYNCHDNNGNVTIDGTPQPDLYNCPMNIAPVHETEVHVVNNSSQAEAVVKTEVITVVVTATPQPTTKPYIPYKPVNVVRYTPVPTFTPTASPSATKIPSPTKAPFSKPVRQNPNIFQIIIGFFQNLFH